MLKMNTVWTGAVMLAGLSVIGCSNTPTYPPAPAQTSAYDWNYLVGPGDSVNVFVWRNPEVSGNFPVRPDGKMTMNLVEDLPASGKTPSQLARDIEKALAKDWTLREKFAVLKNSIQRLDKIKQSPRTEVVLNVLNYAREKSAQEA